MNVKERRDRVFSQMVDHSALVLFSDGAMDVNHNFFYLTGLSRQHMILVMTKEGAANETMLFIEEADPNLVRWTGKRVSVDEAKAIAMVEDVSYLNAFESRLGGYLSFCRPDALYFDCTRGMSETMPAFNLGKAKEYAEKYPGVQIRDLYPIVGKMRMQKDAEEAEKIKGAIAITDKALQNVMKNLKPGKMEYQVQADFEYSVHDQGAKHLAFPTIAGAGINGTMLHYESNSDVCRDGDLILLDLGAKYEGYCADITRTYPVNGKFSERQRKVYDIVLKANREVAATAKAGMTTRDLQKLCSDILAQGCIELGLIRDAGEIRKYYMHGVSHHLGIDVHDVTVGMNTPLAPGAVISDEPGLYIDEWGIGIRIEDDLLIKEDGCEVLSADVIRDPDEIEAFMANANA